MSLKLLERKLGLVPKQYPPMSFEMERLARQQERREKKQETPLSSDIEGLIDQAVERKVAEALERQPARQPPHVQRLMRQFDAPAPVSELPKTPAPKKPLNMIIHRDAADRALWAEMSDGTKVEWVRDGAGKTIAMKEIVESPVLPALDVPYKAGARQYNPGEPR